MLPVLLTGQVMATLDTSIVNVAAPAISHDLGLSGAPLQLVIAGYLLAYATLLITGARLGDDYGYRRIYVIGVAVFTVASLACGMAPEAITLICSRIVQGVGAAMMVPQVLSLIQRHFEGTERACAVGYYSMIMALGVTAGQLLGGVLVTVDVMGLSWRPAFLINVPIGLILLLCSGTVLPNTRGASKRKFDSAGVIALSLSMLMIVVPLTFGRETGWVSWTWVSLAAGVLGLTGFAILEKAVAKRGGSPLLDLGAIAAPGVKAGLLVVFIGFVGYGSLLFSMALYMQAGLGFSPIASGLVFTAYSAGFGAANLNWAKLPAPLLRWTPTAALILMAVADLLFGVTALYRGWTPLVMLPLLLLAGTGHGFAFGPVINQMAARMQPAHAPVLSGLVSTATQLSIVLGIATLGTLYLAMAGVGPTASPSFAIALVAFAIALAAATAVACSVRLARGR
jgi:MFS family permease